MPSSSRRRRRRNRKPNNSQASAPPEARDWAALPRDILFDVFLRLGSCREIMRGAEFACTAWRRVAVDEPALWRRVDMAGVPLCSASGRAMALAAVDRGAGKCEAFSGPFDPDSLLYLAERAPSLKSLQLLDTNVFYKVFNVALKKLPLLEDIEISSSYYNTENLFEYVCKACPQLKKLRLTIPKYESYDSDEDLEIYGGMWAIPIMCELRSLELFEFELTADGLAAILDNCPLLESLHITGCFVGGKMDEELRAKCARVKNITLPDDTYEANYQEYYYDDGLEWHFDDKFNYIHYGSDVERW